MEIVVKNLLLAILIFLTIIGCAVNPFHPKKLPHQPPNPFTRDAEYKKLNPFQQDLQYYLYIVKQAHPDIYANLPQPEFDRLAAQLNAELTTETDTMRFLAKMKQFSHRFGDGHTGISSRIRTNTEQYPVRVRYFQEGWYISAIDSTMIQHLGARINQINGMPADSVMNRLMTLVNGENIYWFRVRINNVLPYPANLGLVDAAASDGRLHLVLDKNGISSELTVAATSNAFMCTAGITGMTASRDDAFWGQALPEDSVYYLQFNQFDDRRVGNNPDLPDWGQFLEHVFTTVDSLNLRTIVVDLRYNGGGNSILGDMFLSCCALPDSVLVYNGDVCISELLRDNYQSPNILQAYGREMGKSMKGVKLPYTVRFDRSKPSKVATRNGFADYSDPKNNLYFRHPANPFDGKVILLIGSNTFSSAVDFATMCFDNHLATLYGTPTGGKPSCFGDILSFTLENSKINCTVSYKYFVRPDPSLDPSDAIYPDVTIMPTPEQYFAGQDVVWERVLSDIRATSKNEMK
jgi:hypothetical protein